MSAMRQNEREFMIGCLRLYRDLPSLWNMKSKVYHDRDRKNKDYCILLEKFREMYPDATKDDLKRKLNAIRTNYRKEVKKYEKAMASGGDYVSTLWYYHEMTFLQDQKEISDSECPVDTAEHFAVQYKVEERAPESRASTFDEYEESSDNDIPPQPTRTKPSAKRLKIEEHFVKDPYEHRVDKKDEFYYWAMAFAADLRSMDRSQQLYAKKAITEILVEGQFGQLHRNSVKINESPL